MAVVKNLHRNVFSSIMNDIQIIGICPNRHFKYINCLRNEKWLQNKWTNSKCSELWTFAIGKVRVTHRPTLDLRVIETLGIYRVCENIRRLFENNSKRIIEYEKWKIVMSVKVNNGYKVTSHINYNTFFQDFQQVIYSHRTVLFL